MHTNQRLSSHSIWIVLSALMLLLSVSASAATDQSVEAFVRSIYGSAYIGRDSKGIELSSRAQFNRYFVPDIANRMADDADAAAKREVVGTLDGDPFINAQDWQIKSFDISVHTFDATHADATVTFENMGRPFKIVLALRRLKGLWRVADIDWGTSGKLSALFHAK